MRRVVGEPEPAVHFADRVGERPASGHDQQRTLAGRGGNRRERGIEVLGVRQHAAAKFHDGLDESGPTKGGFGWPTDPLR